MTPKPHVSAALAHLRFHVTAAGLLLGVCLLLRLLVFGFVHYTQVRWTDGKPAPESQELSVVQRDEPAQTGTLSSLAQATLPADPSVRSTDAPGPDRRVISKAALEAARRAEAAPADLGPALSQWDVVLGRLSGLACTGGVGATIVLALIAMLGVIVAGGGAIPGVEKAVSAATWALVLAFFCLPWREVLPSIPFPGVFEGYDRMTAGSDAVGAGRTPGLTFFAAYALMPVVGMIGTILVVARFRAGVERGVIVTSVSEIDELLDREMAGIRDRGVGSNLSPRTIGVLSRAVGDVEARQPDAVMPVLVAQEPAPRRPIATPKAEPARRGRNWVPTPGELMPEGEQSGAKRPI